MYALRWKVASAVWVRSGMLTHVAMAEENISKLLEPGDKFGDYTVEKLLGKGGMGAVYLIRAPGGERYAVKIMFPDMVKKGAEYRKRLAREAEFAMRIHHKNLITVYDVGEDPETGFCYIIMDYVPGGSVADRLERHGPFPMAEAVSVAAQVALALEVAHRHGVVHRDIKPDNIMFDADGTPKLADLGVAKFTDDAHKTAVTTTGMIIGTPAYMAPEQMMDSRHVDSRADIYALGVTLYEMLTGKRPNEGNTAVELLAKAIKGEPLPDVRVMRPEVSAAVAHVLSLMCAPKPENRPPSSIATAKLLYKALTGDLVLPKKHPRIPSVVSALGKRKHAVAASFAVAGFAALLAILFVRVNSTAGRNRVEQPHVSAGGAENGAGQGSSPVKERRSGKTGISDRRVRNAQVGEATWYYTLRGGEAVIWRGHYGCNEKTLPAVENCNAEHVVVPSELDGYKVSSIGSLAFFRCQMKSVVVPEGVRSLGTRSFYGCDALEHVKLPFTLDIIDKNAFEKCASLERLDIGECPYVTGSSFNCPNLASVSVSQSNHEYKQEDGCLLSRNLRELVFFSRTGSSAAFPKSVEEIGEGAFMCCNNLKKVTIPGNVKKIGSLAFASCRNLSSVEIMSGVCEIDDMAFAYCPKLQTVSFPAGLEKVGTLLFDRCRSLQCIKFEGDAPQVDSSESLLGDVPENLRILVRQGTKGWKEDSSFELPERWPSGTYEDSRPIYFSEDARRM